MRVFVWTRGHTIAQSIHENPPDGIEVISKAGSYSGGAVRGNDQRFAFLTSTKTILDNSVYWMGLPRFLPCFVKPDMIHTISGLVPIVPRPWMTSVSMPSSFFGLNDDWSMSKRRMWAIKKVIRSRNCKHVTCFSNSTLIGLRKLLGSDSDIDSKLVLMYPAIDHRRFLRKRKRDDDSFRVLFVGNHFFDKGGRELHRAVAQLADRYDIQLDIVATVPEHHRTAFEEFVRCHQEEWVRWHIPGVPRTELVERFYPNSDVFVMCSYIDVFGFVFLEAMASGLPVIGANVYAQREIISDGQNGYVVDVPSSSFEGEPQLRTPMSIERYRRAILDEKHFHVVVEQLRDRLTTLIEDGRARERMGDESFRLASEGKFGVDARNLQLGRLYRDAIE